MVNTFYAGYITALPLLFCVQIAYFLCTDFQGLLQTLLPFDKAVSRIAYFLYTNFQCVPLTSLPYGRWGGRIGDHTSLVC